MLFISKSIMIKLRIDRTVKVSSSIPLQRDGVLHTKTSFNSSIGMAEDRGIFILRILYWLLNNRKGKGEACSLGRAHNRITLEEFSCTSM